MDLVFENRIHDDLNSFSIDTAPTGFAPADGLLAAVDRDPQRSLAWWIGRGPDVRQPLIDEWVRMGVLHRTAAHGLKKRRRYGVGVNAT